ncbi:AAA family ATPase, partial [Parageobacillus sp. SY1]
LIVSTVCDHCKDVLSRIQVRQAFENFWSGFMKNINPIVIAIGGKIGSGKTTIANILSKELNIKLVSFGDYVRKVAKELNIEDNRKNIQKLGNDLIDNGVKEFCTNVLKFANWTYGQSLIVEGVRHKEVLSILKQLTYQDRLLFVFVSLRDEIRKQRIMKRGKDLINDLHDIEQDSTEIQLHQDLSAYADIIINNEDDPYKTVKELLIKLKEKLE